MERRGWEKWKYKLETLVKQEVEDTVYNDKIPSEENRYMT